MADAAAPTIEHPYRDPRYAAALADLGEPLAIDAWRSWALRRPIADSRHSDATGLYPMLAIAPGADLVAGRQQLTDAGLVSFVAVADPFATPPMPALARAFDVCRPFKQHAIIDRRVGPPAVTAHHRYEIKRARRFCSIEHMALGTCLERWLELYGELVGHHNIGGAANLSRRYFESLAAMPQLACFAARRDGMIVAMSLWLDGGRVAYNHLGASSAEGYQVSASYALYDAAIEHYGDCDIINLGGGAGLRDLEDGLTRFKRGFANTTATALLCGMTLDHAVYAALAGDVVVDDYFPAYRRAPAS